MENNQSAYPQCWMCTSLFFHWILILSFDESEQIKWDICMTHIITPIMYEMLSLNVSLPPLDVIQNARHTLVFRTWASGFYLDVHSFERCFSLCCTYICTCLRKSPGQISTIENYVCYCHISRLIFEHMFWQVSLCSHK